MYHVMCHVTCQVTDHVMKHVAVHVTLSAHDLEAENIIGCHDSPRSRARAVGHGVGFRAQRSDYPYTGTSEGVNGLFYLFDRFYRQYSHMER